MKIRDIRASAHKVEFRLPLMEKHSEPWEVVFCEVEVDEGIVGVGFTGNFLTSSVVAALHNHLLPLVRGMDARDLEAIHHAVWWKLNQRTMTGVVSSALSCLDIALWDIQGKAAGRSVAALLGNARQKVPAYVTFGAAVYDRDQLVEVAKLQVANGARALKMVVAANPGGWREDVRRVRAVRDAIGEDVDLMVDGNYKFDPVQAKLFCRGVEQYNLSWFEEPLHQNDARMLADLRQQTRIPLAAGQMEGHRWRLRELILSHGVDYLQPNVCYCGGYTEARKAFFFAQALNVPVVNGGGLHLFNMHTMAGLMNGGSIEYHLGITSVEDLFFEHDARPVDGWVSVPADRPGLGLTVNRDALKDTLKAAE